MEESKPSKKKAKVAEEGHNSRKSLVDLAYRRAKAAKSVEKLVKAGKIGPQKKNKGKESEPKSKSRKNETEELFQDDFGEDKKRKGKKNAPPKKPSRAPGVSKRAFKSKSRYVMLLKQQQHFSN
jgi:ATP-dependent RNA helicase DDX27